MLFKIVELKEKLDECGERVALIYAARLNCLGDYHDRIKKGYSASRNPSFYRELGDDPEELVQDAYNALRELIESSSDVPE